MDTTGNFTTYVMAGACLSDEELAALLGKNHDAFLELFERYQQPVFRYFAMHTGGNATRSAQLAARTFHRVLSQAKSLQNSSFASGMFGIAWDVLNQHQAGEYIEGGSGQSEWGLRGEGLCETWVALRRLSFYSREAISLRLIAGLNARDIGLLLDRKDRAVKLLVYRGVSWLAAEALAVDKSEAQTKDVSSLATAYDCYLSALLTGARSDYTLADDLREVTERLNRLRQALSLRPDSRRYLVQNLRTMIAAGSLA